MFVHVVELIHGFMEVYGFETKNNSCIIWAARSCISCQKREEAMFIEMNTPLFLQHACDILGRCPASE